MVNHDASTKNCYSAQLTKGTSQWTLQIKRWAGIVGTIIGTATFGSVDSNPHTIEIVNNADSLTALFDGTVHVTVSDSTYSANNDVGFISTDGNSRTDDFYADDVAPNPTLTVEPDPIEQIGPDPALTLTGTETAWDPNTNSPTFTVDKGSVISQEVTSATTASMQYALPHVTDTLTVTDPSTGATAQVALDSTLGLDLELDLSPVLDILGTPEAGHTVTGDQTTMLGEFVMPATPPTVSDIIDWFVAGFIAGTVPEALLDKLDELYGILPPEQQLLSMATLNQVEIAWLNRNLGLLTDDVASIAGEEELSLRAVINAITGVPNIPTSELKDLIDAMTVDATYTLLDLYTEIQAIRGVPFMDLRTLYDAVLAIPPMEVSEITDYLDWITGTKTVGLSAIKSDTGATLTNVNAVHDDLAADFSNLTAAGEITLQDILDAISAHDTSIDSQLTNLDTLLDHIHDDLLADYNSLDSTVVNIHTDVGTVYTLEGQIWTKVNSLENTDLTHVNSELDTIRGMIAALETPPPIWPGQANVTLGAAVPLTADLRITGSIDGVIVQLATQPHKLSTFPMGDHSYSYRLGFITFEADAGWLEPWQYLGFDSALYCPRQMRRAAAVRIRYLGDAEGTAQPWTND